MHAGGGIAMDLPLQPLGASTPKKARLDQGQSSEQEYIFISDSGSMNSTEDSELLFINSDEEMSTVVDEYSKNSSLLFISTTSDAEAEASDTSVSTTLSESKEASSSKETPSFILSQQCCDRNCLQEFSIKEFNSTKERFNSKTPAEQRQFLADSLLFLPSHVKIPETRRQKETFVLYGKQLCKKAFATLLGTSERRLDRIKACSEKASQAHGNQGIKRPTVKATDASAWMRSYFESMGDYMPDSNRIHLPSFLTKRDLYQKMCSDLTEAGMKKIISQSTFYELWEKEYSHVVIPEVSDKWASKTSVYELRPPFLKVVDCSGKYRPLVRELNIEKWPTTMEEYIAFLDREHL